MILTRVAGRDAQRRVRRCLFRILVCTPLPRLPVRHSFPWEELRIRKTAASTHTLPDEIPKRMPVKIRYAEPRACQGARPRQSCKFPCFSAYFETASSHPPCHPNKLVILTLSAAKGKDPLLPFALAFLSVIPAGNLLHTLRSPTNLVNLSTAIAPVCTEVTPHLWVVYALRRLLNLHPHLGNSWFGVPMFSIRFSTIVLIVPFGAAVVFLLWFLWNLLHESATITFRVRSILRSSARHPNSAATFRPRDVSAGRMRQFDR
jgi:hypothetical protein